MKLISQLLYYTIIGFSLVATIGIQIKTYAWNSIRIDNALSYIMEEITTNASIISSDIVNTAITGIIVTKILVYASVFSMMALLIPSTIMAIRGYLPEMIKKRLIYIALVAILALVSPLLVFTVHHFIVDDVISKIEYQINDSGDYNFAVYVYNDAMNKFVYMSIIIYVFTAVMATIIVLLPYFRTGFNASH